MAMLGLAKLSIANAYALIALVFGMFFLVVTPPFGTGDETAHFERSYEIATGQFLGAKGLPAGMQAFIDDAFGRVKSGAPTDAADFARWAGLTLERDTIVDYPDPIRAVLRLHSPLCYVHFAPVTAVGLALGLSPLSIFYLARLTALLIGIALVRAALARAPQTLRPPLAFVALLPTAVVYFAGLNIESLLVGLGFYYFALIASFTADAEKKLTGREIALLAGVALLLGQFKTGYLLVPAVAVILPRTKFSNLRARAAILALIIVPGIVASLGWALTVKNAMLGELVYSTMNGNHVDPSAQLAGVVADPLGYAGVILRTAFASEAPDFALKTFLGVGGWTNIPIPAPFYALLTAGLLLVWMSGAAPPKALTSAYASGVQMLLFAATALIILTLVYFQWDGVGDPVITGFQGRYLFAATPLLVAAAPTRLSLLARPALREAIALGAPLLGLAAMAGAVLARYYS